VPCPTCNPGESERVSVRAEVRHRPNNAAVRPRGQGERITREGTFRCRACHVEKPLSDFYVSRSLKRGHQSWCKRCDNDKRAANLRGAR
jgi:hypothetical protein